MSDFFLPPPFLFLNFLLEHYSVCVNVREGSEDPETGAGQAHYLTWASRPGRNCRMSPIDFSNLQKKATKINRQSDELTKAIAEINEKLNSFNLGLQVYCP